MSHIRAWSIFVTIVGAVIAIPGVSVALAVPAVAVTGTAAQVGALSGTVSVASDAPSYAPGDPVSATVTNSTTTPIAPRGGLVCSGSPWPFGVQRLDDTGEWQDIAFPRMPPCVGIAVALLGPGQSQTKTFAADPNAGTYRVVYVYNATDGSGEGLAVSDPYTVEEAPGVLP